MNGKRYYFRPEFWGVVVLVIAGVVHLISRLDISFTGVLENYWPALFIIVAIFQITSTRYRDAVSSTLLILVGTMLLLFKSGVLTSESFKEHWPASLKKLVEMIFQSMSFIIDTW